MVELETLFCTKKSVHGGTLLKSVSAVGFSGKTFFLESVSFHRKIFGVTNLGLVLSICIVNAMVFKKLQFKTCSGSLFTKCYKSSIYYTFFPVKLVIKQMNYQKSKNYDYSLLVWSSLAV